MGSPFGKWRDLAAYYRPRYVPLAKYTCCPCDAGCWRKGCGVGSGSDELTVGGRERKEHFGELVQMDGSFHAWLEERGPEGCLIDMVDDATNATRAQLGEQETISAM